MNLWRLEWLRLVRTRRLLILIGVYVFFGLVGPATARYLPDIVERFGAGIEIIVPEPVPADGIAQYLSNAAQIGLLTVVFVAAGAIAFDANREMGIFLRTRAGIGTILAPRVVLSAVAAVAAFILGTVAAVYETGVLIGWPDMGAVATGVLLHALYLIFAVAVTAFVSALVRGIAATTIVSIVALIVLALFALIPPFGPWLPSKLLGALDVLVRGGSFDYVRAIVVTVVVSGALVVGAVPLLRRREA